MITRSDRKKVARWYDKVCKEELCKIKPPMDGKMKRKARKKAPLEVRNYWRQTKQTLKRAGATGTDTSSPPVPSVEPITPTENESMIDLNPPTL